MTIEGRVTADPELRFTPAGHGVASFTVAANDRVKDGDNWKDGEAAFFRCSVWRQQAENVAESLRRGDHVVVVGKMKQRSYETREGEKRTVLEVECSLVAIPLMFRTVTPGEGRASRGTQQQAATPPATRSDDPWGGDQPPF